MEISNDMILLCIHLKGKSYERSSRQYKEQREQEASSSKTIEVNFLYGIVNKLKYHSIPLHLIKYSENTENESDNSIEMLCTSIKLYAAQN